MTAHAFPVSESEASLRAAASFDYRYSHVAPGRGERYDDLYRPGTGLAFYWTHFERPYLEAQLGRLAEVYPGGRYLDFACGTGRILEVGARAFADVTGIDVSGAMLAEARAKVPNAAIVQADVLTEPIDVGRFDVITLFRFLLRAGQLREGVLAWLRRAIADDGTLIVNNHRNALSHRGITYRIQAKLAPNGFEDELLTDRQMEQLLSRAGFEIVESFGFGGFPSWRNRLLLDPKLLLEFETRWTRSRLARLAKNRIYVCRPIA